MALRRVRVPYIETLRKRPDKGRYAFNLDAILDPSKALPAGVAYKNGLVGPRCQLCQQPVDREEVVEGVPGQHTWCEVLVRCHGAEEVKRFDFDSVEWDERDLMQAMSRARWFVPSEHVDAGKTFGGIG
jgi:hypothetical protein